MSAIVRIDDEVIGTDDFIRTLKLSGQFEGLIEQLVRDKLTVRAAKKQGLQLAADDIQERADQFRRTLGLHRAADMNHYLDTLGVSLDEFEVFITDGLYQEKMMAQVCSDAAVEQYFKLNSPKFDSVEISHIVLDSEGKAKEMMSALTDDPDSFADISAVSPVYADALASGWTDWSWSSTRNLAATSPVASGARGLAHGEVFTAGGELFTDVGGPVTVEVADPLEGIARRTRRQRRAPRLRGALFAALSADFSDGVFDGKKAGAPITRRLGSPIVAGITCAGALCGRSTAMSLSGSVAPTSAGDSVPSEKRTVIDFASATMWRLVRMSAMSSTITPARST